MTKIEHLQFLALMIPTFVILAAAAVSMADIVLPADEAPQQAMTVAVSGLVYAAELAGDPME